jgi:hypothetical protein
MGNWEDLVEFLLSNNSCTEVFFLSKKSQEIYASTLDTPYVKNNKITNIVNKNLKTIKITILYSCLNTIWKSKTIRGTLWM